MNTRSFPAPGSSCAQRSQVTGLIHPQTRQNKGWGEGSFDGLPSPGANAPCCRELGDLGKATNSMISPLSATDHGANSWEAGGQDL